MRRSLTLLRCLQFLAIWGTVVLTSAALCFGQDKPADKEAPTAKKPVFVSPSARLASAKTVVVQNAGGTEIPYNVIAAGLEGWARFQLVDSPSQADIIVEVTSPEDDKPKKSSGFGQGRMQDSAPPPSGLDEIKLVVYDARTHIALWSATERPKGGFRQRAREDHLVEAASRLLTRFRERMEPPAPKP